MQALGFRLRLDAPLRAEVAKSKLEPEKGGGLWPKQGLMDTMDEIIGRDIELKQWDEKPHSEDPEDRSVPGLFWLRDLSGSFIRPGRISNFYLLYLANEHATSDLQATSLPPPPLILFFIVLSSS